MKITKVEVQNWGPYFGTTEFEIGSEAETDGPVSVIWAMNNHGKTSFLRALKWVITGGQDGQVRVGPNINWTALRGSSKFETSVTLHFYQGDNFYKLKRFLQVDPEAINTSVWQDLKERTDKMPDNSRTSLQKGNDAPWGDVQANAVLKRLFPPRLSNFYFFDAADLLAQYDDVEIGKNSKARSLLQNVESALGFVGFDEMILNLESMLAEANAELLKQSKNESRAKAVASELSNLENRLESSEKDKNELERQIESLTEEIDQLKKQITGNEGNKQLQLEQKNLEANIEDKSRLIKEKEQQISQLLEGIWMAPMSSKIKRIANEIQSYRSNRDRLLRSKEDLERKINGLESQQNSKKCNSCGSELQSAALEENAKKLTEHKKELETLQAELSEIGDESLLPLEPVANDLFGHSFDVNLLRVFDLSDDVSNLRTGLATDRQQLNTVRAELQAVEDIDFVSLFNKHNSLFDTRLQAQSQLASLTREIEDIRQELLSKEKALLKLVPKAQSASKRVKLFRIMVDSLKSVQSDMKAEIRQEIESKANEVLSHLKTQKDGEHGLFLDDYYNLDTDKPQPSAGFKQTLFLSFLFAIPLVAKAPFPLVIDSPLQHIDQEHFDNFVEYCKTGVDQLVLLPHDREMKKDEVFEVFEDKLANFYVINHDENTGTSQVEKLR